MGDQSDQLHTLTEAARLTGLTVDALRQRAKRGKLESVKGNDGLLRVRLPLTDQTDHLISQQAAPDQSLTDQRLINADDVDPAVLLEREAGELRAALARERDRADRAEAGEEMARTLAERRGDELAQQGRELTAALVRVAAAEGEVKAITAEAKGLREALEEARRPFWRRLFRA